MGALYIILPIGKPAGQAHPNPSFLQDDRLALRAGPVCLFFQAWGGPFLASFTQPIQLSACCVPSLLVGPGAAAGRGRSLPPTLSEHERALVRQLGWGVCPCVQGQELQGRPHTA